MAYVKILNIKSESHLSRAVKYAMNAEKTLETQYISTINCFAETASDKMAATKKQLGKQDGRLGYQIIHSFAPGEVSPELAHKISVEYAERLLNDFEVVIGTHVDREHVHSHIVVNSVSCVTGKKLHLSKNDFHDKVRGISNELCEKHGLSVIEPNSFDDLALPDLKTIVLSDIEHCIAKSNSVAEFYVELECLNYDVDLTKKHITVRPPQGSRNWRLDTLGYTQAELKRRILGMNQYRIYRAYGKYRKLEPKSLTRFQALYLYYMYMLGNKIKTESRVQVSRAEYRQFEENKKRLKFITDNNASAKAERVALREKWLSEKQDLEKRRDYLNSLSRKFKKLFEAQTICEQHGERGEKYARAVAYLDSHSCWGNRDKIRDNRVLLAKFREENRVRLLDIWRKIKLLDEVGADDRYFRLGIDFVERGGEVERKICEVDWER